MMAGPPRMATWTLRAGDGAVDGRLGLGGAAAMSLVASCDVSPDVILVLPVPRTMPVTRGTWSESMMALRWLGAGLAGVPGWSDAGWVGAAGLAGVPGPADSGW